tara:strand:- start:216 stop:464 length:249 start_codon:yes stop_codon:yes gene_type:complete
VVVVLMVLLLVDMVAVAAVLVVTEHPQEHQVAEHPQNQPSQYQEILAIQLLLEQEEQVGNFHLILLLLVFKALILYFHQSPQ